VTAAHLERTRRRINGRLERLNSPHADRRRRTQPPRRHPNRFSLGCQPRPESGKSPAPSEPARHIRRKRIGPLSFVITIHVVPTPMEPPSTPDHQGNHENVRCETKHLSTSFRHSTGRGTPLAMVRALKARVLAPRHHTPCWRTDLDGGRAARSEAEGTALVSPTRVARPDQSQRRGLTQNTCSIKLAA
jgi:hypothetical protein